MLIGHYGAGFALKKFAPRVSLGFIFLAVQFVDIVWAVLVLVGIEKLRITPGFTATVPVEPLYQPFSHSLATSLILTIIIYLVIRITAWKESGRARSALVLAVAILSHFLLDLPVHTPDLPLLGWDSYKLGFGLWNNPAATHVLEWGIYLAGFLIYMRSIWRSAGIRKYFAALFGIALFALGMSTAFSPPPKSGEELAFSLLLVYIITAGIAFIVDSRQEER